MLHIHLTEDYCGVVLTDLSCCIFILLRTRELIALLHYMFCGVVLTDLSSCIFILLRTRELIALICFVV